jgi:pimeloyl-ACP methyl ester carboxylesterase
MCWYSAAHSLSATMKAATRLQTDNTIRLSDGRDLGYAEYGDPDGRSLFFFHGGGGSRLLGELCHEAALRQGVRLIAPDRPGMGLSDPHPRRRLLDWPHDLVELADRLGLDMFATMGHSAGAAHALACAASIPDRLTAVIAIGGPFPGAPTSGLPLMNRVMLFAAGWSGRFFANAMSELVRDPVKSARKSARWLNAADQRAYADPDVSRIVYEATREAIRRGTDGVARDVTLCFRRWGFDLRDLRGRIYLWHGEDDRISPVAFSRHAADRLPNCSATFCPWRGPHVDPGQPDGRHPVGLDSISTLRQRTPGAANILANAGVLGVGIAIVITVVVVIAVFRFHVAVQVSH